MSSMFWISLWRLLTKLSILASGFIGDLLLMEDIIGDFLIRSVLYFDKSFVLFREFLFASITGFVFTLTFIADELRKVFCSALSFNSEFFIDKVLKESRGMLFLFIISLRVI
jgi:hypothetical protein